MAVAADAPAPPARAEIPAEILRVLPAPEDERGFMILLRGSDAPGWTQCGPGAFTVSNAVAYAHGGMGLWWYTNQVFTNFVLRGEWRMDSAESDSGVFVRFPDPKGDPWNAVKQGHEFEIGDDPAGKEASWQTGALYPFQPPARRAAKPAGEWNSYEFAAIGQTYIIRINGQVVNVWTDPQRRTTHGHIGLQNYEEGKNAQHRNLRIRACP